jgi:uncharacterized membrane protein HdeD (DUF308 family)
MDMSDKRPRWGSFLALGIVLAALGVTAILLPTMATMAASSVLGTVLALGGAFTLFQTWRTKGWAGAPWQLFCGAAEIVGGILIFINPYKGAGAVTLLIAIVLFVQGIGQIGLAWRIRPQVGWTWLAGAAAVSVVMGVLLVLRFPFAAMEGPGAMAGLALAAGGVAYIGMAVGLRKTALEPQA